MKQNQIQIGQEYIIDSGAIGNAYEGIMYAARRELKRVPVLTGTVKAIRQDWLNSSQGVLVELTGAAKEAADTYNQNYDYAISTATIINARHIVETVADRTKREADAAAERDRKQQEYEANQAIKGAELDDAALASLERRAHEDAGYSLQAVRDSLGHLIKRAQELQNQLNEVEKPSGYKEEGWTTILPEIHEWRFSTDDVHRRLIQYHAAAKVHNTFVEARQAAEYKRNNA